MANEVIYYNSPIELYRCFLEHPKECLEDVLHWCVVNYAKTNNADYSRTQQALNFNGGTFREAKERAKELEEKIIFSGVTFSIPHSLYWDFRKNTKTEKEIKCLLCYLALKSIQGTKKYYYAENAKMFRRMCGFGRKEDFEKASTDELGKLGRVFSSERNLQERGRRIREATMQQFDSFHCSTHTRGLRHFYFMIAYEDRDKCMKELEMYIKNTRTNKQIKNYKI